MKMLRTYLDSGCGTGENTEDNNQSTTIYAVNAPTPAADLVVTNVTLTPAVPTANGNFTATVTVKNQGTIAGDGKFLDVWSHQSNNQICGAVGNIRQSVGVLAAGATKTLTFTDLPAENAGIKMLRAYVDSGCGTGENTEDNNQKTIIYAVNAPTPAADLVITNVTLTPAVPTANGTFTAVVTVKNQGTIAGDGRFLDVWSHKPDNQVCGAVGNQRQLVGVLAAGATKTLTFTDLPAGTAGTKMLRAYVDSACVQGETLENNNQKTQSYTVQ
jgi:subtilase family serine protease